MTDTPSDPGDPLGINRPTPPKPTAAASDPAVEEPGGRPGGAGRVAQLEAELAAMKATLEKIATEKSELVGVKKSARQQADDLEARFDELNDKIKETEARAAASAAQAAAAEAGAKNPGLVARMIGADADLEARLTELRETDAYLFGSGSSTPGHDPTGGDTGSRKKPVGTDGLGDFLAESVGL